jgi:hypothetical protein
MVCRTGSGNWKYKLVLEGQCGQKRGRGMIFGVENMALAHFLRMEKANREFRAFMLGKSNLSSFRSKWICFLTKPICSSLSKCNSFSFLFICWCKRPGGCYLFIHSPSLPISNQWENFLDYVSYSFKIGLPLVQRHISWSVVFNS